jgi:hypothetical protein
MGKDLHQFGLSVADETSQSIRSVEVSQWRFNSELENVWKTHVAPSAAEPDTGTHNATVPITPTTAMSIASDDWPYDQEDSEEEEVAEDIIHLGSIILTEDTAQNDDISHMSPWPNLEMSCKPYVPPAYTMPHIDMWDELLADNTTAMSIGSDTPHHVQEESDDEVVACNIVHLGSTVPTEDIAYSEEASELERYLRKRVRHMSRLSRCSRKYVQIHV